MSKKASKLNLNTICMAICAILVFKVFYETFEYSPGDPISAVTGRIIFSITGALAGAIIGLILAFIIHIFFKPSRTNRLLKEQNRILYDNNNYNKTSKVDELNKLNELKKSGMLREKEFIKLKNEILNRK